MTLLFLEDELQLVARARDANGFTIGGTAFAWTTSDETVVAVSSEGMLTAKGKGEGTVTASTGDVSGSATITVDPGIALLNECMSCHWERAPGEHFAWGFPFETCLACHDTTATMHTARRKDHAAASGGFALVEAHTTVDCARCHVTGTIELVFAPTDQDDCVACHQADYDRQHAGSGVPTRCWNCHSRSSWIGASFDHSTFPLSGPHVDLACESCHDPTTWEPRFSPLDPNDCYACHQADYDFAHAGLGYPTTCLSCHDGTRWQGAIFDHAAIAGGFSLTGAHEQAPCTACHDPDTWDPLYAPADQNDCVACHQSDYDRQHAGSGFPTTCIACHNTSTWADATFDHTTFPLSGPHLDLSCENCHDPVTWEVLYSPSSPDDCIACHQDEYDRQHAALAYPTTCLTCHDGSTWSGATFDHDATYFPIFSSGAHPGEWETCATCHTVPSDFSEFTCFNCHEHEQSSMDERHEDIAGYVYDSQQCYGCHPDGREP